MSESPAARDPRGESSAAPGKWAVLLTVVVMTFMSTLDSSIVNVALPTMQRALGVGASQIQWVSTVYLLVCCAAVLVFGRLGDRFGKVRLFQAGVALFTLGSLLCGLSTTFPMLVAARVVQGVGAASATANNMGIVTEAFPAEQRGRALGIVSTFVSLGMMCGPTVGGLLVARLPWESIFVINVPVGAVALLVGSRTLPRDAVRAGRRAAAGGAGLAVLRDGRLLANLATMFLCFVAVGGTELILPFFLQDACGMSSDLAGLVLTAIPLAMAVVGPVAGALSDRIGCSWPCLVGLVVYALGIRLVGGLPESAGVGRVVALMALMAAGTGLFQSPNNSLVMGTAGRESLGLVGSLVSLVRYLGMSVGISGGTALLYGRMSALAGETVSSYVAGRPELFLAGFSFAFSVMAAGVLVAAAVTATDMALASRR